MANLQEAREVLEMAYVDDELSDEEFLLLYDISSSNPAFPYRKYDKFDLEELNEAECLSEFRFKKNDIYRLKDVFRIPDSTTTYNRLLVYGTEALCILLKRYSYPNHFSDMIPRFGRSVPQLSIISSQMLNELFIRFGSLLCEFNPAVNPTLQPSQLEEYCRVVSAAEAPLANCFGFVDGTVRAICRPGMNQRIVYNGRKRVHSLKYQSVVTPNGLIANMFGPVEGRRHDCAMLAMSNLLPNLKSYAVHTQGSPLCIYGDPAYPIRVHLQCPFRNVGITPEQQEFKKWMSAVRISVEWLFGDILEYFAFLDFKKKHKLYQSPIGKMYLACALLTNARTCLYGNTTSDYFSLDPPPLEEYFV